MLHYLYTGRVVWPERGVTILQEAVLKLADKYALYDLKAHVGEKLAEGMDEERFFHLVYLADDHSCEGLMRACGFFFAGNRDEIVEEEEWGKLKADRAAVATLLLEAGGK